MIRRRHNSITRAQYPKFFSMLRKAALNLGLDTPQEIEDYRHRVLREEAGCESIKQLGRKADFDACIRRFAADAGDYAAAVDAGLMDARRRAYVVKVMAVQIMQLKGGSGAEARSYLEAIMEQAKVVCGRSASDNSFWMDVSEASLQKVLQILDTYRRKLVKSAFPGGSAKFDDTVRYEVSGPIRTRVTGIPRDYYAQIPFKINVR